MAMAQAPGVLHRVVLVKKLEVNDNLTSKGDVIAVLDQSVETIVRNEKAKHEQLVISTTGKDAKWDVEVAAVCGSLDVTYTLLTADSGFLSMDLASKAEQFLEKVGENGQPPTNENMALYALEFYEILTEVIKMKAQATDTDAWKETVQILVECDKAFQRWLSQGFTKDVDSVDLVGYPESFFLVQEGQRQDKEMAKVQPYAQFVEGQLGATMKRMTTNDNPKEWLQLFLRRTTDLLRKLKKEDEMSVESCEQL